MQSANINLVIATPCFGGQLSAIYAASLFKLQKVLRAANQIDLKVLLKDGDALITRARARSGGAVSRRSERDPSSVRRCGYRVRAGPGGAPAQHCSADVCAAIYPIKRIDWDKVRTVTRAERPNPGAAALQYVFEVEDPNAVVVRGGFAKVRYAGSGFLMIRRSALERMCANYPNLRYKRDHSMEAATASNNRFALFDCMIDENGTYLSEDFSFCKRWSDMGGEIWADLESRLNHVGPLVFRGDLSSQFMPETPAAAVA